MLKQSVCSTGSYQAADYLGDCDPSVPGSDPQSRSHRYVTMPGTAHSHRLLKRILLVYRTRS
jgi:hypothetical protein